MLKSLFAAGAAIITCAHVAVAADLPSRVIPPVFTPIPIFTWTGFYVGGNAGYAWTDHDTVRTFSNDVVTFSQLRRGTVLPSLRLHTSGFTAGGQAGYNYQFTPGSGIVVGVEADAAYTDLSARALNIGTSNVATIYRQRLEFLGTVRGRLGYAWDRFLVYGTGGYAYGETQFEQAILANNAARSVIWSGNRRGMETGYAYGGGIEYALPADSFLNFFKSSAVTTKIEYLRYELHTRPLNLVGGLGRPFFFTDRYQTEGNLVRAGLNYKFGTF